MSWLWRYEAADGSPAPVDTAQSQGFPTQADAETWIGEEWRALLDSGVEQVSLLEDDHVVYGPMSLRPQ
jgi:hypothetical protein